MRCPECGASIPDVVGFPKWCECGWNLEPPPVRWRSEGRFARFAAHLGRSSGERMAARLRDAEELRAGWTAAKVLAYVVAAGVHVFTVALFVGGVAAVVTEFPEPFSILFGLAMVCAALVMRPRVPRMPEGEVLDAPALWGLVGAIAEALDRPAPE